MNDWKGECCWFGVHVVNPLKIYFFHGLTRSLQSLYFVYRLVTYWKGRLSQARWKREEKAKEELLTEASSIRKEREQIEDSAKSKQEAIKSKAEKTLHKYKDDIEKLEKVVSELRSKTDSSKIAALRRGIDGSYASTLKDIRNSPAPIISKIVPKFQEYSGVKRERECVMCLSEEMSVVFLPCAHQVVCTPCNELHEKQGMKDCPSCRSTIQRRICVRYYARSWTYFSSRVEFVMKDNLWVPFTKKSEKFYFYLWHI